MPHSIKTRESGQGNVTGSKDRKPATPRGVTKATSGSVKPRPLRAEGKASTGSARYTVGLAPNLAHQVERYAKANESSVSKAIAALVRIGLEGQQQRKREFFEKLRENLATADPSREDELVDEFRSLILGQR